MDKGSDVYLLALSEHSPGLETSTCPWQKPFNCAMPRRAQGCEGPIAACSFNFWLCLYGVKYIFILILFKEGRQYTVCSLWCACQQCHGVLCGKCTALQRRVYTLSQISQSIQLLMVIGVCVSRSTVKSLRSFCDSSHSVAEMGDFPHTWLAWKQLTIMGLRAFWFLLDLMAWVLIIHRLI